METVVEGMGGLQTQHAPSGYIGLWSRLEGMARDDYTAALEGRRLVQGWVMRATIHTVTAADYWPMAVAVREPRRDLWRRSWRADDARMAEAARVVREELADGPLRQRELVARTAARGFSREETNGAALWVDLVRVPPHGTWERPRADRYELAERWLPVAEPPGEDAARAFLLRRYLGGFGPASLADAASWMGVAVADLRPLAGRMELRRFRDEAGRELLDNPDGPLPDPETPAPPRFIGSFDAMLLTQARRTGVLPEAFRPIIFNTRTPRSWHTFLLDGRVAGTFRYDRAGVSLEPLRRLTAAERAALDDEAHRLERFVTAGTA
ncbi:MAG TPA: winged helix DNA-binding domain-containing protein [Candidatus Limnocylindria bacterium]|jgi:hypothetical protein